MKEIIFLSSVQIDFFSEKNPFPAEILIKEFFMAIFFGCDF